MKEYKSIKLVPNNTDYITFVKTTCDANNKPVPLLSAMIPNYFLLELCGLRKPE